MGADGIEAYHLTDGIGHGLATNGGSDAEVLQFVVEKVDFVVCGLGIQLAQGIAERHIIIFTRDALCCSCLGKRPFGPSGRRNDAQEQQ